MTNDTSGLGIQHPIQFFPQFLSFRRSLHGALAGDAEGLSHVPGPQQRLHLRALPAHLQFCVRNTRATSSQWHDGIFQKTGLLRKCRDLRSSCIFRWDAISMTEQLSVQEILEICNEPDR